MQFNFNTSLGYALIAAAGEVLLQRVKPALKSAREVLDLALDPNGLSEKLKGRNIATLLPAGLAFANAVTLQRVMSQSVRHCGCAQGRRVPKSPIGSGAWRFQINCLNVGRHRLWHRPVPKGCQNVSPVRVIFAKNS